MNPIKPPIAIIGDIVEYKDADGLINNAIIEQVLPNNLEFVVKIIDKPYEAYIHKNNIIGTIRPSYVR